MPFELRKNKQYNPNMRKGNRITAWSYSRWKCYNGCPSQAFYRYIQKLPEPSAEALERGSRIHDEGELYVLAGDPNIPVPKAYESFTEELHAAMECNPQPELQLAFTKGWKPTTWMASDVWLRSKIDLVYDGIGPSHKYLIDYKTGKVRVDENQLELYAVGMFSQFKELKSLDVELWFLDHDQIAASHYERSELRELKKKWKDRAGEMMSDKHFAATPSFACAWCPFNAKKVDGAPCEHGKA